MVSVFLPQDPSTCSAVAASSLPNDIWANARLPIPGDFHGPDYLLCTGGVRYASQGRSTLAPGRCGGLILVAQRRCLGGILDLDLRPSGNFMAKGRVSPR